MKKTEDGTEESCDKTLSDNSGVSRNSTAGRSRKTEERRTWATGDGGEKLGIVRYFANPHTSHERGVSENINGLFFVGGSPGLLILEQPHAETSPVSNVP